MSLRARICCFNGATMGDLHHGDEVDVTPELVFKIFALGFDVILTHTTVHQTRKQGGPISGMPVLMIDYGGQRMKQR